MLRPTCLLQAGERGGLYFRVIGLPAAGRMNLVYNMGRLVQIDRLRASGV